MLYVEKVIIHNFKSFRHSVIRFSRGFNCIIGPNGSGKSNIFDSILFGFGESSLKRIRAHATTDLISRGASSKGKANYSYVTIFLGGDKEIKIKRVVFSNGKIKYKLNDKRSSRQEILETLHSYGCYINETNTIAQGEIARISELNHKERRGLIDIAAGIEEFDSKKAAALKELEKVEEKINGAKIQLHERQGFLNELKKEKESAEKYIALNSLIKDLNYTILKERENEVENEYSKIVESLYLGKKQLDSLNAEKSKVDEELLELSREKAAISNKLNERSIEVNDTNKKIEAIERQMAVLESKIKNCDDNISSLSASIASLAGEKEKISGQRLLNAAKIKDIEAQISEKSAKLKDEYMSFDIADFERNTKKYEQNRILMEKLAAESGESSNEISSIKTQISDTDAKIKESFESLDVKESETQAVRSKLKELEKLRTDAGREAEACKSKISSLRSELESNEKEQNGIDSAIIELREQIATYGGTQARVSEALQSGLSDKFYGRAYDLCDFDEKYASAIYASSISRLNYFIVDDMRAASEAISLLKEKALGRASFIPLKEIRAKEILQDSPGMDPLIKHVRFDPKLKDAFTFIFSNTFIIDRIESAKKLGLGKHRFVTLEGELVEQSGVVTGGQIKAVHNQKKFTQELDALNKKKLDLRASYDSTKSAIDSESKKLGEIQVSLLNAESEIKHLSSDLQKSETEIASQKKSIESQGIQKASLQSRLDKLMRRKTEVETRLEDIKKENAALYSAISGMASGKNQDIKKGEMEFQKSLRADLEKLKIDMASIGKENDMLKKRLEELGSEIENKKAESAKQEREKRESSSQLDSYVKEKEKLAQEIKTHDTGSSQLYGKMNDIEQKMSKLGFDKGKIAAELEKASREIAVAETKKAQQETRLADIKSELAGYAEAKTIDGSLQDIEVRLASAKGELERLGNVNMMAPAAYDQKSKDVEEVTNKLIVLENEKNSIMNMISELEDKKVSVFNRTFESVNKYFQQLYSRSMGVYAHLELENPKDIFESGLSIKIAQKDGGAEHSSDQMSGGEKAFALLILIFAILMQNPLQFYIFDEIDASLDKENSKKLSNLIKEMGGSKSQFLVVSHNDSMIAGADTAIGVVKQNNESKVVGIQLVGLQNE